MNISFEFVIGNNQFQGDATISPGRTERRPDLNHPGDPAESPEVHDLNLYFKSEFECSPFAKQLGYTNTSKFEPEGLWIKEGDKFYSLEDFAEAAALQAYSECVC
jgi:hypothetical protein